MNVVARLEASVQGKTIPTLSDLGGVDAVLADQNNVVVSPFFDVLIRAIANGTCKEKAALADLILEGFNKLDLPSVFRDAVDALLGAKDLWALLDERIVETFVKRIGERVSQRESLVAAYALEGLLRCALQHRPTQLKVLSILYDLEADDGDLFMPHAVRIVGIAYHAWNEKDLLEVLVRLQASEEAADEVAFELAMIAFADALDASDLVGIQEGMRQARDRFGSVLRRDPHRLDAALHVAVIDLVLKLFVEKTERLDEQIEALGRLLAERHDLLQTGHIPEWLNPRVDRELEWWELLRVLRRVDAKLRRPSWTDAAQVMEQVLSIYRCEQTLAIGGALDQLFAPRIEAAFIRQEGLAAHLDDLLADINWLSAQRPVAERLRSQIARVDNGDPPTRLEQEGGAFPRLNAALRHREATGQIPDEMAITLEAALRDKEMFYRCKGSSEVQSICRKVSEALIDAADYHSDVRYAFDELTRQVVAFCMDRQNADLAQLGPRGEYLRRADAIENDLQRDLRQWLRGNMTSVKVLPEVPGVATGRTDLFVDFGAVQFVIELKRHHGVVDDGAARDYRAQAVAYQATGPKLGMLGILELVKRSGPPPSLQECVWTDAYVPEGSELTRHLVIFRVPGMLKVPSKMK